MASPTWDSQFASTIGDGMAQPVDGTQRHIVESLETQVVDEECFFETMQQEIDGALEPHAPIDVADDEPTYDDNLMDLCLEMLTAIDSDNRMIGFKSTIEQFIDSQCNGKATKKLIKDWV